VFDRVLMVCAGNICRSPMAEVLLGHRLRRRGLGTVVQSAGIVARSGQAADSTAVELMRARGLDLEAHRARQLTPALIRSFDVVLVMEAAQQQAVEAMDPSARGRVQRLGRLGGFDVPDPYQRGQAAFESALALIERGVDDLEKTFWSDPR
jgi:protein-tyrosine phosphatase